MTSSTATSSTASLAEVDVELFTFVERYATNLVRWDLLLYFGYHPDAKMTPAELAKVMRRTVKATTKELDDLSYLRVLSRHYLQGKVTYQLTRRGPARRAVMRLAAFASKNK